MLIYMYGIMVAFEPTRAAPVAGGRNDGLNFGNMVADSKDPGTGDTGGGIGGAGRKPEFWHCGGEHLKRNFLERPEEKGKEKTQKDEGGKWCFRKSINKCADGETEVKGGQLHMMFTSLVDSISGV